MKKTFIRVFPMVLAASVSFAQTDSKTPPSTGTPQPAAYETPPAVLASYLLPPEVLTGKDYSIDPDVATDGFMGIYHLHSKFGDYECAGREMLFTRLAELNALEQLEQVSKTKAFLAAVGGAAEEPVKAAVKIVTKPVKSAEAVPVGMAHLFKDVGEGFVDTGKTLGKVAKPGDKDQPKPPPSREDPFGYNKIRNEWARKLGVDPYTTNRVLAVKMNHLATIGFGTDKVASAGIGFGTGGLGIIARDLSWLPDIDEHLLTAPPADVTAINARRLKELGVSKKDMKPLLENAWFTPTLQSRFVNALVRLRGVNGLGNETQLARLARSEEEARFLCASLEMLDRYHANNGALLELSAHAGVPAGVTGDGTLVVATPVDVMAWTQTVAEFATPQQGSSHAVLCITGLLTQRAQDGFKAQGWQVIQYPRS